MNFNVQCTSCQNQLLETGLLLESMIGPLVCCDVCRRLYYIDVVTNYENKPVIIVQPTKFTEDEEFQYIRTALSRVPLKEYLPKEEEKIINPHFDKDLKSAIEESVTPSDLIRTLHKEKK